MMKAFEIQIQKDRSVPGKCSLTYPEWWDASRLNVIYEHGGNDRAICICDADYAAEIKALNDPSVSWPTDKKLDEHGKAWRPQRDVIRDSDKVIAILGKAVRQEPLTEAEMAAIDPEDETPGINRKPEFSIKRIKGE